MRWLRYLLLVLASALFFPVSCTGALSIGTTIASHWSAHKMSRGEEPHSKMPVLVTPGMGGDKAGFISWIEFVRKRAGIAPPHLFPPDNEGFVVAQTSKYKVLAVTSEGWEISTQWQLGDYTFFGHYFVNRKGELLPLDSRVFGIGSFFHALPFAFIFALLLKLFAGVILRRRFPTARLDATETSSDSN